jgi:hypothetical protein
MRTTKLLLILTVGMLATVAAQAEVPKLINYQGKLTTAEGGCLNDTIQMTFTIYSDSFGTQSVWTETQDSVIVTEGIFNVLLGSLNALHDTMFDETTRYLGVQVESDPEMTPLKPMVTVPYAFRVSTIDETSGGTIEGDVNIEGDVIITGDTLYVGNIYIEPTTRHYSIPAVGFRQAPIDLNDAFYQGLYETRWRFQFTSGPSKAAISAPIHLPDGAFVSKVVAYFCFEGDIGTFEARVGRAPLFERPDDSHTDTIGMASVVETSPADYDSVTISSFSDPTIDNSRYCYTIIVTGISGAGYFYPYHARIEYVIDKPLP